MHAEFELSSLAEFTLESELKSVTRDKLYAARETGINRINFGVQSFIERFRSLFNLTSTCKQIKNTVDWSQEIIGPVGFDILYGMYSLRAEELLYDLKQASELHPEIIKLYAINNLAITSQLHKFYAQKGQNHPVYSIDRCYAYLAISLCAAAAMHHVLGILISKFPITLL